MEVLYPRCAGLDVHKDGVVADARTRADTMEREARAKAAALDQDAERRHNEVMGTLEEKRSSLERWSTLASKGSTVCRGTRQLA